MFGLLTFGGRNRMNKTVRNTRVPKTN